MKKTFKFFAFAAATVAMLSSCAKELVVSNEEDTVKTFTVTAEYTEPNADSKTAFVDGENPYVKWLSTDKIIVYESIDGNYKYHHNQDGDIILSDNGKVAKFNIDLYTPQGGAPTGTTFCYTAFYPADCVKEGNGFYYFEVPASQTLSEGCNFAAGSDVLIGKPVNMDSRISTTTNLEVQFKRPGTVVALTLKGITEGETISSVKITAPEGNYISGRSKVNRTTGEVYDKAYSGGGRSNVITLNCSITATGDDKFYFRCLDGIWTSGSEVSINVETDKAYYSKTVNLPKDYVFADGGLTKFGFQGMTREAKSDGTPYTLVTSNSDLCDGASYIFVGIKSEAYYAMAEQNTNNRKSATVSAPVDDVITLPESTGAYTFQLEAVDGGWAIKDITASSTELGHYLFAAATGSNYMKSQDNVDVNAIWTITFNDGFTYIEATESSNRKYMRFNTNQQNPPLFSCYKNETDQSPIYLYVDKSTCKEKVATPESDTPAGEVNVGTVIKLTCATEGATIHYTIDGTEPTAASATYTDADGITINDDCTIKAIAVKEGCKDSDVLTLEYTVEVVTDPVISFDGTEVNIACTTEDATIYYEIGGDDVSDPTSSSSVYDLSSKPSVEDGQTVKAIATKSGAKNSNVVSLKYTSAPVVLTTVAVSGEPTKKTYTAGDSFEPAGLTVTGTFSDSHQEEITDGITWSEPAALTAGQTSVTITATVSDITSAGYTVEGLTVNPKGNPKYVKVTSTADLTDGKYLIVYEKDTKTARVFNGVDGTNDYLETTISNNEIASTTEIDALTVTISSMDGGYSIKIDDGDKAGNYISGKSNSNTIVYGATAVANAITITDGLATILSNSTSFRYNATSGQDRFRYYKTTTTGTSYIYPALYKKVN